jgi:hypothetical protein
MLCFPVVTHASIPFDLTVIPEDFQGRAGSEGKGTPTGILKWKGVEPLEVLAAKEHLGQKDVFRIGSRVGKMARSEK